MDENFPGIIDLGPNPETIDTIQQDHFMADVRERIVGERQYRTVDPAEQISRYHGYAADTERFTRLSTKAESNYQITPDSRVTFQDTHATVSQIVTDRGREVSGHAGLYYAVREEFVIDVEEADPDATDQTIVRFPEVVIAAICIDQDFNIVPTPDGVTLPVTVDDATAFGLHGDIDAFAAHELGGKLDGTTVFSTDRLKAARQLLSRCNPQNLLQ